MFTYSGLIFIKEIAYKIILALLVTNFEFRVTKLQILSNVL